MAKKNSEGTATLRGKNEPQDRVPPAGSRTTTTEGSHELVSHGDGTAHEIPIVNALGQYPPRPEKEDK